MYYVSWKYNDFYVVDKNMKYIKRFSTFYEAQQMCFNLNNYGQNFNESLINNFDHQLDNFDSNLPEISYGNIIINIPSNDSGEVEVNRDNGSQANINSNAVGMNFQATPIVDSLPKIERNRVNLNNFENVIGNNQPIMQRTQEQKFEPVNQPIVATAQGQKFEPVNQPFVATAQEQIVQSTNEQNRDDKSSFISPNEIDNFIKKLGD